MIRQIGQPGQVQLAVHRLAARIVFMHPLGRQLLVYLGQAHPDDRIIGFRLDLVLLQEGFHLRHLRLGHVEQEIVRAVRRQLLLPAFEQIAAQHQQQRQQHERQRKCRQLADGHPRLMQQAVDRRRSAVLLSVMRRSNSRLPQPIPPSSSASTAIPAGSPTAACWPPSASPAAPPRSPPSPAGSSAAARRWPPHRGAAPAAAGWPAIDDTAAARPAVKSAPARRAPTATAGAGGGQCGR